MNTTLYKSENRGEADFGWFKAKYSFSFGQWHNPKLMGFGALKVFNDSVIQPGKGFPPHSHDNFEVITVQLQGKLNHTDVSGTRTIQAGDVQVITAGSGVTHSDLNIGHEEAKQFQIWIAPNVQNAMPTSTIAHFSPTDWNGKWKTLVGPMSDSQAPLHILQDAWINRGEFDKASTIQYQVKKNGNGVYLFVIAGSAKVDNQMLSTRDALGISAASTIEITLSEASDLLLLEVPL